MPRPARAVDRAVTIDFDIADAGFAHGLHFKKNQAAAQQAAITLPINIAPLVPTRIRAAQPRPTNSLSSLVIAALSPSAEAVRTHESASLLSPARHAGLEFALDFESPAFRLLAPINVHDAADREVPLLTARRFLLPFLGH
jgi:hypothetical protein